LQRPGETAGSELETKQAKRSSIWSWVVYL